MQKKRLKQLFEAVGDARNVLILPHNNPDPDAIASAVGLHFLLSQQLGVTARIAYRGIIGRAENRALVRYLGYPLKRLTAVNVDHWDAIAVVDAQPGAGNVTLPPKSRIAIVIDHHPEREAAASVDFSDIRPNLGATSTILAGYIRTAEVEPPTRVATALFYGIKTDTMGLIRDTSPADAAAFCYLQSHVDIEALSKIEHSQVPTDYFKSFATTLQAAYVYDSVLIAYLGPVSYPDLGAEMADILLRLSGIRWVICLGTYKDALIASVRTRNLRGAGQLVQEMFGDHGTAGGHGAMAGGQISLEGKDPEWLAQQISRKALQCLKIPPEVSAKPLLQM